MPVTATIAIPKSDAAAWARLHCSFCGRDANHVRFLAAGVAGRICNTCALKAFAIFLYAYVRHPFGVRS